jgi:hypothetical protein
MLSIVLSNEKRTNSKNGDVAIEGYVLEVLHREFLNINDENITQYEQNGSDSLLLKLQQHKQQKQQLQQQQEFINQEQQVYTNTNTMTNNNNNNKPQTITVNNTRPQIIKLQSFQTAPTITTASSTNSLPSMIATTSGLTQPAVTNTKPIIYVSQSPIKSSNPPTNKLLKFTTNPPQQQILQNSNSANIVQIGNTLGANSLNLNQNILGGKQNCNGSVLLLNDIKNTGIQENKVFHGGEFLDEKSLVVLQQQNQQNQPAQPQPIGAQFHQDQQVLSLVVLTDNSNGGVSYLSLVPQN